MARAVYFSFNNKTSAGTLFTLLVARVVQVRKNVDDKKNI